MIDKNKLGAEIKAIRSSKGSSLRVFGGIVGATGAQIFNLENGVNLPNVNLFYEICRHTKETTQIILDRCHVKD